MKKQTCVAALVSALLVSALAGTLLVDFAAANPTPPAPPLNVDVILPQNGGTVRTTLGVVFKYSEPLEAYSFRSYYYILDGQERVAFSPKQMGDMYCTALPILPNGEHNLTIIVNARVVPDLSGYGGSSSPVRFTVDYAAPTVTVLPLGNATCTGNNAALGFRVTDYSLSWVSYSLDGRENVTVSSEALAQTAIGLIKTWGGNLSFAGLAIGSHKLTVYASNEVGYTGTSEPFYFTVAQSQEAGSQHPATEPFPTTLVAVASGASLVAIATVLMVHFKKRNHEMLETMQ